MIFDSLIVVSTPLRLLTHSAFKVYVEPTIDEHGPIGEGMDLENMLMEDEFFQDMLEDINECTEIAFDRASTYCDSFDDLMMTFSENLEFLEGSLLEHFQEKTLEEVSERSERALMKTIIRATSKLQITFWLARLPPDP